MESFQPLINLLMLLTVLSIVAERVTNVMKLRNADLRLRTADEGKEKEREHRITVRSMLIGVLVAVLLKANIFEILASLNAPWETLGWVKISGQHWVRAASTAGFGTALYAVAGSVITGLGLGFGSKFWHDLLQTAFEIRDIARKYKEKAAVAVPSAKPTGE